MLISVTILSFGASYISAGAYEEAENYYQQKNYKMAADLYLKAVSENTSTPDKLAKIYYKLGKTYAFSEKNPEAILFLRKFISAANDSINIDNAAYLLANLYNKTNEKLKSRELKNFIKKNFPDSPFNNEKYWTWLAEISDSEKKNVGNDIDNSQAPLASVNTNIEYASLDFEKASIKTIISAISSITKIDYKIDFFNITDYATVKSDNKIAVSFLPVLLEKILIDYNYELSVFNKAVKISKQISFLDAYQSIHNYYYILAYSDNDVNALKSGIKEIESFNVKTFFYENFQYLLLSAQDMDSIYKFMETLKISAENADKYITRIFSFTQTKADLISRLLNGIKNDNASVLEADAMIKLGVNPKKAGILKSILTNPETLALIKKLKTISDNSKENSVTVSLLKDNEAAISELFKSLDIESFKNENNIYIFKLVNSSADETAEQLKELFRAEYFAGQNVEKNINYGIDQITVDKRLNSLIIRCAKEMYPIIEELIKKLDIKIGGLEEITYKTRVYSLKNSKAVDLKIQFDDLKSSQDFIRIYSVSADNRTNSLIITADASDMKTINELVAILDKDIAVQQNGSAQTHTRVYNIEYRKALYIRNNLVSIMLEGPFSKNAEFIKIIPIEIQNKIIVITNDKKNLDYIDQWIKLLDTKEAPKKEIEIKTYVYACKNIPAEDLANMLNTLIRSVQQMEVNASKTNSPDSYYTPAGLSVSENKLKFFISENISINPDKTTNAILITASDEEYSHLLQAIEKIDKVPDQIYIDVIIAEATLTDESRFGIEWQYGNKFGGTTAYDIQSNVSLRVQEQLTNNSLPLTGFRYSIIDGSKLNVLMNFMQTDSKMKILSSPKITTVHNKKAIIKIGKEVPVTKVSQTVPSENATSDEKIYSYITQFTEFKDVGISLEVTPTSMENDLIGLKVHLTVSELDQSNQLVGISGNPTIKKRETETFGTVQSSNALAIGGLLKQDEISSVIKIPIIGDLPVIGNLFKHEKKQKENTELLIFLRPTIVKLNTAASFYK